GRRVARRVRSIALVVALGIEATKVPALGHVLGMEARGAVERGPASQGGGRAELAALATVGALGTQLVDAGERLGLELRPRLRPVLQVLARRGARPWIGRRITRRRGIARGERHGEAREG